MRFTIEAQFGRGMFSKFPCQLEHLAGVAELEFQFDFANGRGSASRTDLSFIERNGDEASVSVHQSTCAADPGFEHWLKLVLELLGQQRFQRSSLNLAEIGNVVLDLVLPFPAPEGIAGALRFTVWRRFFPIYRTRSEIPFLPSLCLGVSQ